jgi:serine/threonine-protein kinase/endoribonuclease IRE1
VPAADALRTPAQELAALIASDAHPGVLRCFAMEEDAHFVYVALERCACTLADLFGALRSVAACFAPR